MQLYVGFLYVTSYTWLNMVACTPNQWVIHTFSRTEPHYWWWRVHNIFSEIHMWRFSITYDDDMYSSSVSSLCHILFMACVMAYTQHHCTCVFQFMTWINGVYSSSRLAMMASLSFRHTQLCFNQRKPNLMTLLQKRILNVLLLHKRYCFRILVLLNNSISIVPS